MTQVLIDRATLEQLVAALNNAEDALNNSQALIAGRERFGFAKPCYGANEIALGFVSLAITEGRAALANAEPTGWIAVSDRLPIESDGEVLVRMQDGRPEIAWATYWHGANTGFAEWTFRDQDEDETPTHWMPIFKATP